MKLTVKTLAGVEIEANVMNANGVVTVEAIVAPTKQAAPGTYVGSGQDIVTALADFGMKVDATAVDVIEVKP